MSGKKKYTSIEASNNEIDVKRDKLRSCFSVKAKIELFFRQTSLPKNVKHLVG